MKPDSDSHLLDLFLFATLVIGLLLLVFVTFDSSSAGEPVKLCPDNGTGLEKFSSDAELVGALVPPSSLASLPRPGAVSGRLTTTSATAGLPNAYVAATFGDSFGQASYSGTNVQVTGVDEADIVKTDGDYVYLVSKNKLIIVKAYPATEAQIVFATTYENFTPTELFVSGDRLLVIGSSYPSGTLYTAYGTPSDLSGRLASGVTSARLYDIAGRGAPQLIKTVDIEGYYDTSRMIGNYTYFLVNTNRYTYYRENLTAPELIPLYREDSNNYRPIANATDIYYLPPAVSQSFTTICSINLADGQTYSETLVTSGGEVYASQQNLFLTRFTQSTYSDTAGSTTIVKLHLDGGKIMEAGTGKVPGRALNQFSMDETDGYFRIATTRGYAWDTHTPSASNVYVLDSHMDTIGSLEGLAPGEQIYSTRFMGSRCYMVTFKQVDPLFVIDLSDPRNPEVLGKLKIPGYSNYLHPYDETHVIGIGKDTTDVGDGSMALYQGVKMALFDVSDVEHPKEVYKVVIGDRGTDSPVLTDHRAFLFDRNTGLLVLPVTVTEIQGGKTQPGPYGVPVFKGAYVYNISLSDGFVLRGKVTQYQPGEDLQWAGYYDYNTGAYYQDYTIRRSLYIGNVLYTLSQSRLQLNDQNTLAKLKVIEL